MTEGTDPKTERWVGVAAAGNTSFDVPFISKITDTLWIGGCRDGLILPPEFEHVISLSATDIYRVHHNVKSFLIHPLFDQIHIQSNDGNDQWGDAEVNEVAVDHLATWVNWCCEDGITLLHCSAGLNRSGLVGALALSRQQNFTMLGAISWLREKRSPAVLCNKTFEAWLLSQD